MLFDLRHIYAGYNGKTILRDINFTINSGDFIGIIGPNGGGKTTLLKVLLDIIEPIRGEIIKGEKISVSGSKSIGYLPQYSDFDRRFPVTIEDIVLSGFITRGKLFQRYKAEEKSRAKSLMKEMGIYSIRKSPASEISGGQLQRALLCRALASDPDLLILDEPNTYVDNQFEHELYDRLVKYNNQGKAILLVTHDVGTVSYYIKTIACVNETLHYHNSNIITEKQLASYNCPLQIITHGDVPHTVLKKHDHFHE